MEMNETRTVKTSGSLPASVTRCPAGYFWSYGSVSFGREVTGIADTFRAARRAVRRAAKR